MFVRRVGRNLEKARHPIRLSLLIMSMIESEDTTEGFFMIIFSHFKYIFSQANILFDTLHIITYKQYKIISSSV